MNAYNQAEGAICLYPRKVKIGVVEGKPEMFKLFHLRGNQVSGKDVVYYAAKAAHVPVSAIEMTKEALFDAITYFCAQGHAVQIPYLGALAVQFRTKMAETPEDATSDLVKRKYLRFWPKKEIREQCNLKNIHVKIKDILGVLKDDADSGDPSEDEQDNP